MSKNEIIESELEEVEISIIDIADWILKNRSKLAFVGWTKAQLQENLLLHIKNNTILFGYDNGELTGIIIWTESPAYKIIHINQLMATTKLFLKRIIGAFHIRYGCDWKIRGNRHGYLKDYGTKTMKLLFKLSTYERKSTI